jgi:hypothetical protein
MLSPAVLLISVFDQPQQLVRFILRTLIATSPIPDHSSIWRAPAKMAARPATASNSASGI